MQPSSPSTFTVQGFTPINQLPDPTAPSEEILTPVQPGVGPDKGKKRRRKAITQAQVAYHAIQKPRIVQSKKAKREHPLQDISNITRFSKPKAQANSRHYQPREHSLSSTIKGTIIHQNSDHDSQYLRSSDHGLSPQTHRATLSPLAAGLDSINQVAFEQEKPQSNMFGSSGLQPLEDLDPMSSVTQAEARKPGSREGTPSLEQTSFNSEGMSSDILGEPTCQVPCSSGVQPEIPSTEDDTITTAAVTALPFPNHCLLDSDHNGLNLVASENLRPERNFKDYVHHCNQQSSEDSDINDPELDDFLPGADDDCSPVDMNEAELSTLLSEFTNCQSEVPGNSPDFLTTRVNTSFSSGGVFQSSDDDDFIKFSSSTSFVESSSPYLQPFPAPGKAFHQTPVQHEHSLCDHQNRNEDAFMDDDLEAGLLDFQTPPSGQALLQSSPAPNTLPPRSKRRSTKKPGNLVLKQLTGMPSSAKASSHKVPYDQSGTPVPFVRGPFPTPVGDRSPVLGFSHRTLLRTCFRIGEALNAGAIALRTNHDAVIELFTRVIHSERPAGNIKQQFLFGDMFAPDKPPYLKGTYGLWKGVELWDLDSKVFLGDMGNGKMARVVGRIRRDEKTKELEMTVLSAWEAGWDDVGIVKGIVDG
ncbi:MAG: hypothetical protein Q9219_004467 [cf. Caloplaca sp. 3 TL-2023]